MDRLHALGGEHDGLEGALAEGGHIAGGLPIHNKIVF